MGNSPLCEPQDSLRNDFESVIFDIEPEIRRCKEALLQAGAIGALLAGSGSSVFGIFAGRTQQQRALDDIKLEAGWRVFPCVTVSRNEYRRALGNWAIPFLRSFNSETDLGASQVVRHGLWNRHSLVRITRPAILSSEFRVSGFELK